MSWKREPIVSRYVQSARLHEEGVKGSQVCGGEDSTALQPCHRSSAVLEGVGTKTAAGCVEMAIIMHFLSGATTKNKTKK